jgi:hypothetical protein
MHEEGQEQDRLAHTRVDERRSTRGYDRGREQQFGEEEQGEGRGDERGVRRQQKRWRMLWKRPRGRAISTARSLSGLVSDEYGEVTSARTLSVKNGVAQRRRHKGGERKEAG